MYRRGYKKLDELKSEARADLSSDSGAASLEY
jgi:hypothetical protein